jgi:hypothetical protein
MNSADVLYVSGHSLWLDEAGILHVRTDEVRDVDLAIAKELVATCRRLAGDRRMPLLVDLRRVRTMNRDARAYFSGPATECWSATALLIDSPLTRAIANFFMGINRPRVPTRMFGTEGEAFLWLRSQQLAMAA